MKQFSWYPKGVVLSLEWWKKDVQLESSIKTCHCSKPILRRPVAYGASYCRLEFLSKSLMEKELKLCISESWTYF